MLFVPCLLDCGGMVSDGLVRIAQTEMDKAQKTKAHRVRVNASLLNKRLVGAGNIEPVDFAEVLAGQSKLSAPHQSGTQA